MANIKFDLTALPPKYKAFAAFIVENLKPIKEGETVTEQGVIVIGSSPEESTVEAFDGSVYKITDILDAVESYGTMAPNEVTIVEDTRNSQRTLNFGFISERRQNVERRQNPNSSLQVVADWFRDQRNYFPGTGGRDNFDLERADQHYGMTGQRHASMHELRFVLKALGVPGGLLNQADSRPTGGGSYTNHCGLTCNVATRTQVSKEEQLKETVKKAFRALGKDDFKAAKIELEEEMEAMAEMDIAYTDDDKLKFWAKKAGIEVATHATTTVPSKPDVADPDEVPAL